MDKKQLAAIAGVMALITAEEQLPLPDRLPPHQPTEWTHWGRHQTMQQREMFQRRLVKRK